MALHSSKTKAMVIGTSFKLRTNAQSLEIKLGSDVIFVRQIVIVRNFWVFILTKILLE
jgi:hypothetical protein